jgi:hypothetical protein
MTLEQLDAELDVARASLRRLREDTVAEFTAEAEAEANPYTRETLLAAAEQVRAIGTES